MKRLEEQQLHILHQSLGAVKEVKVAGREAYFEGRLRAVRRDLAAVEGGRAALGTAQRLGVETALIVGMLAVLWLVTRGGASGADTVSLMGLFAYAGFRVVPSANRIMLNAGHWRDRPRLIAKNAIADFNALDRTCCWPHGPEPVVLFHETLVCEDVTFAYDADPTPAVSNVHLRLRAGESLGIVGATGWGRAPWWRSCLACCSRQRPNPDR